MRRIPRATLLSICVILVVALAVRVYLLTTPLTELEGDEAIVGLMARHILAGERPIFYYMQPYMGSLEAYLVAGVFSLFGSSTLALKLVPLLSSILFTLLIFATGLRVGGVAVAFLSGLLVAVPPAFLAIWSLKARGGYIETLVLGQILILLAMDVGRRGQVALREAGAMGLLAGLGAWVNPLIVMYLLPIAVYLGLALRSRVVGRWLIVAAVGCVAGAAPLLAYNLANGFATADLMLGGAWSPAEIPHYLRQMVRVSLPILAGLAQASSSPTLFWPSFSVSPAGRPWVGAAVLGGFLLVAVLSARRLPDLLAGGPRAADGKNLLALLLMAAPAIFLATRFRELVTEPRYLLPMYSAAPLLALLVMRARRFWRWAPPLLAGLLLSLNLYSLASQEPALNLPDTAPGSTAANRAELAHFLLSHGLEKVYTDYWIAYPLAFESEERVIPSVISGGFNRYIPYAYEVSVSPRPAFVFVAGTKEERLFVDRLREHGVRTSAGTVSIYNVYWDLFPLDAVKP